MSQQVNLVTKAYLLFYISNYKLVTANWSGQFYDFHPAWIHPEHMWRLCQAGTHPQCHPIGQEGTPQQHHRLEQLQDQVKWRIQEQGHLWQRGQPDFRPPSSLWIHKNWLNWISPNNTRSFVIGVQQMYDLEHRLRWVCTVKGFQSDHYPLNWSCGAAKLSSSGILKLISKNQVCPSSTQTHDPCLQIKLFFHNGTSKVCPLGYNHDGFPVYRYACMHSG